MGLWGLVDCAPVHPGAYFAGYGGMAWDAATCQGGIATGRDGIATNNIGRDCWMGWDGVGWGGMGWDGMGWDGVGWGGMGWSVSDGKVGGGNRSVLDKFEEGGHVLVTEHLLAVSHPDRAILGCLELGRDHRVPCRKGREAGWGGGGLGGELFAPAEKEAGWKGSFLHLQKKRRAALDGRELFAPNAEMVVSISDLITWRCREIWGDARRSGEMQGDMGRCREI